MGLAAGELLGEGRGQRKRLPPAMALSCCSGPGTVGPRALPPLLLFVPEMPLGGDSCGPRKSRWTCRAGRSSSQDGPSVWSLASGRLAVLGNLLWVGHLLPPGAPTQKQGY